LSPTSLTSGASIFSLILCGSSLMILQGLLAPLFLLIAIALLVYILADWFDLK
jgi:hypothetical protein